MKKPTPRNALYVLALLFASGAAAETQTGNLTVTTTIASSCDALSPSGNLVLSFDGEKALDGQDPSGVVEVQLACSGNPTITNVVFDGGKGASQRSQAYRAMQRSGTDGTAATHYLGYKLYLVSSQSTPPSDGYNDVDVVSGSISDPEAMPDLNAGSFGVKGIIFEADGNAHGSAAAVPAGNYSDTVTMTITY